ncbi:MAG: hypothetical protein HY815_14885 [Candidatus Riflebacteria bacterium]|nr:hypothetical protein [Candidatus Riflebacteria bacterium]
MTTAEQTPNLSPILIDLGKKRRRSIKRLRRGKGRLMENISETIEELRESGKIAADARPVIVLVRERRRKGRDVSLPISLTSLPMAGGGGPTNWF